jgi:hypothetical protein
LEPNANHVPEDLPAPTTPASQRMDQREFHKVSEGPPTAAAPDPVSHEEALLREAHRVAKLEDRVRDEPRDVSWAFETEQDLQSAVLRSGSDAGAPGVLSLTCKTSVCKMEVSHASWTEQQRFMQDIQGQLPAAAGARLFPTRAADGSYMSVVHLIRAGYPIPSGNEE